MTQRDRAVVAALSVLLVVLAIGLLIPSVPAPGSLGAASASPSGSAGSSSALPPIYREGIVGSPSSITPLTARTQADRDLSRLVFSGLVARGADSTYVPDLAASWTTDSSGKTWTFSLRSGAQWQDGTPVTADDVVFTVGLLKDPAYRGPLAGSWREVTVARIDAQTVQFTLASPIAGFLEDALVGILPQHLLAGTPVTDLADSTFANEPVGSGPFRLVHWDATSADLIPASTSAAPALVPGFELEFFSDSAKLAAAYRSGSLDSAVALDPAAALDVSKLPGSRLLAYPTTTFTSVAINLRPGHPELAPIAVRKALLQALDRPAMVTSVLAGLGTQADSPVPPGSWAFDPKASPPVKANPTAAAAALKAAGWTKAAAGWEAPKAKVPFALELLSPDDASNPIAWSAAEIVTSQWRTFGLKVSHVGLAPTELVSRLSAGTFVAALVDVNIGIDPDLYPLFASSQALSGGANITGIQDSTLNGLLVAARQPGTDAARRTAFSKLEAALAGNPAMLPLFFEDDLVVVDSRVSGPSIQPLADLSDRFWDVLAWRLADGR
ncbi:MAG: ABC transporter substrate-binding protein [Candidatus Limnocylindrales bacterium]